MSKKFYYCIFALAILIVILILLPAGRGHWLWSCDRLVYSLEEEKDDCARPCFSSDQCECGARGYVYTKSLGGIDIPYFYKSCTLKHILSRLNLVEIYRKKRREQQQREKEYKRARLLELYRSNILCDSGWIPIDNHCERCDSSETFKVSESDCLKCNQYEELRLYDSQSGECRPK